MNTKIRYACAALALGAVSLVGCGEKRDDGGSSNGGTASTESDEGGGAAAGATIAVNAKEFAFDPSTIDVAADVEFTIEVNNTGAIEHDFNITGYEAQKISTTAGNSASGSFTLAPGSYVFYCSIAGHKEAGMTGTLNVG